MNIKNLYYVSYALANFKLYTVIKFLNLGLFKKILRKYIVLLESQALLKLHKFYI